VQIKPGLRAEDRQCARAGAIGARLTFVEHEPKKIVILAHEKWLTLSLCFAKRKKYLDSSHFLASGVLGCFCLGFASDTPASSGRTLQGRAALAQKGFASGEIEPNCLTPVQ